ncbi:MAG: BCCT family transporter [Oscillospiraceae bacterium]
MSTWLDSIGLSGFPQSWTVFYWAWWAGYAPFLGMFIARISKGTRTVKSMVVAPCCQQRRLHPSLVCWATMAWNSS